MLLASIDSQRALFALIVVFFGEAKQQQQQQQQQRRQQQLVSATKVLRGRAQRLLS